MLIKLWKTSSNIDKKADKLHSNEARLMGVAKVKVEKPNGPNFHLRITTESQQNQSISVADCDW